MRLRLTGRLTEARCEWLHSAGALGADMGVAVYLVGGPVRDLILGRTTLDTDIAVEGDAHAFARALAERDGADFTLHPAFETAVLRYRDGRRLDVTRTRAENYPRPGALPEVSPAGIEEDLHRRDFTINAMALKLSPGEFGSLFDPYDGYSDLRRGVLAALHEDAFHDDPTRILRAARFASRLSLRLQELTQSALEEAVNDGCLDTVSRQRLLTELWYLLGDTNPRGAMEKLNLWGATEYLGLPDEVAENARRLDTIPVAARALGFAASDTEVRACAALALCFDDPKTAAAWVRVWPVRNSRNAAVKTATDMAYNLPGALFSKTLQNSKLYDVLHGCPRAAMVAMWVGGDARVRAHLQHFTKHLAGTDADITGQDLQKLGYTPGPVFREALQAALEAKLDHDADREGQLAAAQRVLDMDAH
ncbi:MAG: CCA tRNA nucleotidyltransferase [Armatimonadota bacterium]